MKGRPLLVALDLFPAFYCARARRSAGERYRKEYEAGRLSLTAKRIMDSLARESPQYTRGIRAECFMLEPGKTREFERAMGGAAAGALDREDRGALRADLLVPLGPARALAAGRGRGRPAPAARPAALERLLSRYLAGAVYSTPALLARLFGLPRGEVEAALAALARAGARERAARGGGLARPVGGEHLMASPPPGFRYIDVHTHLHPEWLSAAIRRWFVGRPGWDFRYGTEPEWVARFLAEQDVERFVFFSYAHKPGLARELNAWLHETARRLPAGLPLGTLHPGDPDVLDVAREALDRTGSRVSSSTSTCSGSIRTIRASCPSTSSCWPAGRCS